MPTITGGELIVQMLQLEGVSKVFGIIDGTYFGFYSKLAEYGIDLITPRHEATAAHMAGAYARLTGKLGVCMASNGPGVANILAGVPVENAEGNRVLLITSSRRSGIGYPDRGGTYQYFNQSKAIGAMAKWSGTVTSSQRIGELTRRALRLCYRGRPGVVHLDIPEDIINGKFKFNPPDPVHTYRPTGALYPAPHLVEAAAQILKQAKLPIIHAGSGVIHAAAYAELATVAQLLHAPVCTSWSGRGVLPETDPLAWPMVHVKAVNELRNAADAVLCIGSRLGETDWWGKAPYWQTPSQQKMIQVDIDPEVLGLNRPADVIVPADAKLFLSALIERLEQPTDDGIMTARQQAVARLAQERDKDRAKLDEKLQDMSTPMITAHVGAVCREVCDDDAVVVFDGGNTAVWGNFYFQLRTPNCQLSTHHFGMLGAGLGQSLGAASARPDKQVVCIIGDGAFGFHPQEIETAVRNQLKPIFLVCSDRQWGMVKINQQFALKPVKTMIKKSLDPDETINTDLGEIAYDQLAKAMGAHGERVADPKELKPALERCLAAGKCAVIHVDVDPVKHMWAPGLLHFKEMHQEPAGK
jgi:acetolactate synthase-1/2/3 large subunit